MVKSSSMIIDVTEEQVMQAVKVIVCCNIILLHKSYLLVFTKTWLQTYLIRILICSLLHFILFSLWELKIININTRYMKIIIIFLIEYFGLKMCKTTITFRRNRNAQPTKYTQVYWRQHLSQGTRTVKIARIKNLELQVTYRNTYVMCSNSNCAMMLTQLYLSGKLLFI